MESKLQKILVDDVVTSYLKPTDFPIGEPQYYIIVDAHPIRTRYANNKIVCTSEDCITGKANKKLIQCATCQDADECRMRCKIYMHGIDKNVTYIMTVSYKAQVALSSYVKTLLVLEPPLDAPDVITKIIREQDGEFTVYSFDLYAAAPTDSELELVSIAKRAGGENYITSEDHAILFKSFGLEESRAINLSKLV